MFPVAVLWRMPRIGLPWSRMAACILALALTPASGAQATSTPLEAQSEPTSVSGQVINAVSGLPVPRALVRLGSRSLLTDHEGKFRFDQNTDSSANVLVFKPGFYFTTEYGDPGNLFLQGARLAAPLELLLYPEALITGAVLGPEETGLPHIPVMALREVYLDGRRRWVPGGQTATDAHGNFRLPVPAGEYRLETGYVPRDQATGEAVLPEVTPSAGSGASQVVHLQSGEEQHFELRPREGRTHVVELITPGSAARGGMNITATLSNGSRITPATAGSREPGSTKLELPTGTYTLTARRGGGEASEEAETVVTVPDHDISGVSLQFSPVPTIPVEMIVDEASSSASSTPNLGQLGLALQSEDMNFTRGEGMPRLIQLPDHTYVFEASPGTYRLQAQHGGAWYITSAIYGSSDLLQQELTIVPGAAGTPIQLTLSNQTGSLQGTVSLDGSPAACWVYLVPSSPNAQGVIMGRSNTDGRYTVASLPPGSYQAIAFERRHAVDAESLIPFQTHVRSVSVSVGDPSSADLDAVPASELTP